MSAAQPQANRWPGAALLIALGVLLHAAGAQAEPAQRVVSLNPSLTAMLVELGAAESLVGVDAWSARVNPELSDLPTVGGLFDPSLEAVVALEPDLVAAIPSLEQRDFRGQLAELGVRVVVFENLRFEDVLSNIAELGALVGRTAEARARIDAIRTARSAVEREVGRVDRPRCLLVLQRDPIFVVGGASFIDEMLAVAGCDNVARALGEGYPRASLEWVVAQAPDVIIDMSDDAASAEERHAHWSRWPTLPAVANGRLLHFEPELVTLPGPHLDRALRILAHGLHGDAVGRAIEARIAAQTEAAENDG